MFDFSKRIEPYGGRRIAIPTQPAQSRVPAVVTAAISPVRDALTNSHFAIFPA